MYQFFKFIFWNKTLHVSDSSSVHHQEFFTVHTAMVCCVYIEKLLVMDRGTVRNMQNFIPKINLRNECIWFVLLQEHIAFLIDTRFRNMQYLLIFRCNSGYGKAPYCCVIRVLLVLFILRVERQQFEVTTNCHGLSSRKTCFFMTYSAR